MKEKIKYAYSIDGYDGANYEGEYDSLEDALADAIDEKAEYYELEVGDELYIGELKEVDVLYIDDFFKTSEDSKPTAADIKLAYMILNDRYSSEKRTLISSEYNLVELLNIDEAVGSRIAEMAKNNVNVKREKARNYRLKKCGMII